MRKGREGIGIPQSAGFEEQRSEGGLENRRCSAVGVPCGCCIDPPTRCGTVASGCMCHIPGAESLRVWPAVPVAPLSLLLVAGSLVAARLHAGTYVSTRSGRGH